MLCVPGPDLALFLYRCSFSGSFLCFLDDFDRTRNIEGRKAYFIGYMTNRLLLGLRPGQLPEAGDSTNRFGLRSSEVSWAEIQKMTEITLEKSGCLFRSIVFYCLSRKLEPTWCRHASGLDISKLSVHNLPSSGLTWLVHWPAAWMFVRVS